MQLNRMRRLSLAGLLLAGFVLAGCSKEPTRYQVSGKVTFKGAPVALGRIYFDPDAAKKNDGLQGYAEIKNGEYDTAKGGKGTTGGPVVVRIEAFDGVGTDPERPNGKPLFPYWQEQVELPKEAKITKNFDVPASAVNMKPPSQGHVGP